MGELQGAQGYVMYSRYCVLGRFQWPSGLRQESEAVRFLGIAVRIPLGHECLSLVNVVCCQIEVSATGRSLV